LQSSVSAIRLCGKTTLPPTRVFKTRLPRIRHPKLNGAQSCLAQCVTVSFDA